MTIPTEIKSTIFINQSIMNLYILIMVYNWCVSDVYATFSNLIIEKKT